MYLIKLEELIWRKDNEKKYLPTFQLLLFCILSNMGGANTFSVFFPNNTNIYHSKTFCIYLGYLRVTLKLV